MSNNDFYTDKYHAKLKNELDFYHELLDRNKKGMLNDKEKKILKIYYSFFNNEIVKVKILDLSKRWFHVDLFGLSAHMTYVSSFIPREEKQFIGLTIDSIVSKVNCEDFSFSVTRGSIIRNELGKVVITSRYRDTSELTKEGLENHTLFSTKFYCDDELEELFEDRKTKNKNYGASEADIMRALRNGHGEIFGFD